MRYDQVKTFPDPIVVFGDEDMNAKGRLNMWISVRNRITSLLVHLLRLMHRSKTIHIEGGGFKLCITETLTRGDQQILRRWVQDDGLMREVQGIVAEAEAEVAGMTTDAVSVLHKRYVQDDPARQADLDRSGRMQSAILAEIDKEDEELKTPQTGE